ncbi:MAG: 4-hydroxy-3-methylbut-2-enyl diphosphate reductase [Clostridiales bacterium]|nr:4-hydroxy-3-methylbut-2-enyl diphosphate reductase [Clostridiales bacterium]
MDIIVAKECGFCMGVKMAVNTAKDCLKTSGSVYCLGQLIHNKSVTDSLQSDGLIFVEHIDMVPNGSQLIIRSHGVGEKVYEIAREKDIKIIDATCPYVSKIHRIVKRHYDDGFNIIIVGKKAHPEVEGINGWCNHSAKVVECEDDLVDIDCNALYCVVSQTTNSKQLFDKIVKKIEKLGVNTLDFFDTICYTTSVRQREADLVAKKCDVMLVLGNQNSANTNKLLDVCRKNCDSSFLITSLADLQSLQDLFLQSRRVGITAGASTPQEFVDTVVSYINTNFADSRTDIL